MCASKSFKSVTYLHGICNLRWPPTHLAAGPFKIFCIKSFPLHGPVRSVPVSHGLRCVQSLPFTRLMFFTGSSNRVLNYNGIYIVCCGSYLNIHAPMTSQTDRLCSPGPLISWRPCSPFRTLVPCQRPLTFFRCCARNAHPTDPVRRIRAGSGYSAEGPALVPPVGVSSARIRLGAVSMQYKGKVCRRATCTDGWMGGELYARCGGSWNEESGRQG